MSSGVGMVLRPLAVVGDVIPFIGSVVRFGTGFVAVEIGLVLSLVTIALGCMTFRPLVGLAILAVRRGWRCSASFAWREDRRRAGPGERQPSLGTT